MSSKCAEKGGAESASSRPPLSLTLWFALSNSLFAFLVVALIALLLYLGLVAQLTTQNHLYLHDEVSLLEKMIRSKGSEQLLADEINVDQHGEEYVKHFIRLVDRNGRTILETAGMREVAPHEKFPGALRDGRQGVDSMWRNEGGKLVLGAAQWVDLGKGNGEQGILEVALDVTNVNSILIGYRLKIYGALLLGFLVCIAVSYLIARKGTRPLREMTEMVDGITASSLGKRIPGSGWPRELSVLAGAMNLMLDRLDISFTRLYNSATNLSHKMRTPLTILRGEAEVALSRERSAEELREVIASGLEENDRLLRLIENILFLANAETGKLQVKRAMLDLRDELEKVVDFYGPCAEDRGITISCSGKAMAMADAPLFRKTAAALISNAITYNAAGGTVELALRQLEDRTGEFTVTDSGCGIAESELAKIFDRFYRIYATRYMDPHGTGLGLPIAQAAMDLHQGSIAVESRPGNGTKVTILFPPAC